MSGVCVSTSPPPRQPLISRAAEGRGYGRANRLTQSTRGSSPCLRGRWSVGLAGGQNQDDLAAFEARFLLDLGDFRGVDLDPVQELIAELLVRHFAAADPQRHLDLVALL